MTFEEFEEEARRMWAQIPAEFKEGIDGIVVKREKEVHAEHPDYYTLGMCFTEPYPSAYSGPDTTRSFLALYHGSFVEVARDDPDFDWGEELWETITHELRHHLEFLADDDELEGLDYAMEESYKRAEGLAFDPWYYQRGLPIADGVYRVEYDVYIEQRWSPEAFAEAEAIEFEWDGRRRRIPKPDTLVDLHFIHLFDLVPSGDSLQIVLARETTGWERVKGFFGKRSVEWEESEADPEVVGEAPGSPGPMDGRPGGAAGGPPRRDGDEG